jgi:hypothetical protein
MKWNNEGKIHQRTIEGERAHKYYYIWEIQEGEWIAGRYWFSREIDYRLQFDTAEKARAYCEKKDREAVIIESVTV